LTMARKPATYPVVDLFAGPGGLGEGFASVRGAAEEPRFHAVVSIERDEFAHRTLLLRHFLRAFPEGEFPDEYYSYLRGDLTLDQLYRRYKAQHEEASRSALRVSLGSNEHQKVRGIIRRRLSKRAKWALIGGPPCQAYSLVGRSRMMGMPDFERDERHFLYLEYLRIIADHRPPVFVMENVKGLLSASLRGESMINNIIADLSRPQAVIGSAPKELGYRLFSLSESETPGGDVDPRLFLVKAEEYGVPQARHRMFIVGIRSDLNVRPRQLRRHKSPTIYETIGNLPPIRSGLSRTTDNHDRWYRELSELPRMLRSGRLNGAPHLSKIISIVEKQLDPRVLPDQRASQIYPRRPLTRHGAVADLIDDRLGILIDHEARSHMGSDLRRYMYASVFAQESGRSPKLADFPVSLLPDHANVELGREGNMFADRFRVQLRDKVSTTITSHISKDGHYFIHYDPLQCRSLTVREAARLQTFPDNYKFEGSRTARYHQVGNAVPPYLARQIGEVIAEVLDAIPGEI
jgi:DNA (cytosine-5)-methyltransferase 1